MGGPGGIMGYLGPLWQALKGQSGQPQAAAQGGPAGVPATPPAAGAVPPTGGVPNLPGMQPTFLDNPLLQGALSSYFAAIGSPKREGLGGAISHGGLAGLQGYEAARANLLKPYQAAAQLAQTGAATQKDVQQGRLAGVQADVAPAMAAANEEFKKSQTNLNNIKAQLLPGDSAAHQAAETSQATLNLANAELDPTKKQELIARANNEMAQAGKATAETAQVAPKAQATIEEQQASAARQRAVTAAMPALNNAKIALDQANAALAQAKIPGEPVKQKAAAVTAEANLHKAYVAQQKVGEDAWNAAAPLVGLPKWGKTYEEFKAQVLAGVPSAAGGGAGVGTGGLSPDIEAQMKAAGYTPTGNKYPDGRLEVLDKDGNPHAWKPPGS